MRPLLVLTAGLAFLAPPVSFSDTILVPADQPTIQAGIDAAANGDTVLVADGIYTGEGNRDIDFYGKAITVTSENGPESCVIDCQGAPGDSHRGFHIHRYEGSDSVFEGFTITDGYIDNSDGGGIFCNRASPKILGNIIAGNMTAANPGNCGGGIACFGSWSLISGNVIDSNASTGSGGGIHVHSAQGSHVTISGNTIEYNESHSHGGGIFAENASLTVRDNVIRFNEASGGGDGINAYSCTVSFLDNLVAGQRGGAIYLSGSEGTIWHNRLIDNTRGLAFDVCNLSITGNLITGHPSGGIEFALSSPEIVRNTIRDNGEFGIWSQAGSPTITGNTISGNTGGGIILLYEGSALISDNIITGNTAQYNGGGIRCYSGTSATLNGNLVRGNAAVRNGGGLWCSGMVQLSIGEGNAISENTAGAGGGGLHIANGEAVVIDSCTITGNQAGYGGGINLLGAAAIPLTNLLIAGNRAAQSGGGVHSTTDGSFAFRNCTITANEAPAGSGIYSPASTTVVSSIIRGNTGEEIFGVPTATYSNLEGKWPGEGNIDADPLFVSGPLGAHYLSHVDTGHAADSPCVDAGDPAGPIPAGTTRTDFAPDDGIVDMGYHYPDELGTRLVLGPGPAHDNPPLVRLAPPYQDALYDLEFQAYELAHYGVNVAVGDVTGNGISEMITGAGPGAIYGPHVRGFWAKGVPLPGFNFLAYGTNRWGVNVAAGDLDGDGFDEVVTGAGPGAVFGPHVRGWDYDGESPATAMPNISFFAYGTPKWGVNVACGDIDGDGFDEIVTGPGPGSVYGPHVRGWDCDGTAVAAIPGVSYLAYGTNQYGVRVGCGDVDGDGFDEIVTAPGPGSMFGAHVRGWNYDGETLSPLAGLSFTAWPYPDYSHGATLFAGADLDGDGRDDMVVGGGPDPDIGTEVKAFRYDGAETAFWFSLEAFEGMSHGTTVAAGRF